MNLPLECKPLAGVSLDIFRNVLAALQGAEELDGPQGGEYVRLMLEVRDNVNERILMMQNNSHTPSAPKPTRLPNTRFDPTSELGYAQVLASETLRLENQDILDSTFGERLVDVRNCLRGMGWADGVTADTTWGFAPTLKKPGFVVTHRCTYVGAGRNVVGVEYLIAQAGAETITVTDNLAQTADELANFVDLNCVTPEHSFLNLDSDTDGFPAERPSRSLSM